MIKATNLINLNHVEGTNLINLHNIKAENVINLTYINNIYLFKGILYLLNKIVNSFMLLY